MQCTDLCHRTAAVLQMMHEARELYFQLPVDITCRSDPAIASWPFEVLHGSSAMGMYARGHGGGGRGLSDVKVHRQGSSACPAVC